MTKTLTLTNNIEQVPILGEWVEQLGEEWSLPMTCVFQLNLALEEAAVNVINYAYPAGEKHSFTLSAEKKDDMTDVITFILEDDGAPFDPTEHDNPDITLSAEEREIGGLGIFLVEQLMQSIHYERVNNNNVLTMIYKVSDPLEE